MITYKINGRRVEAWDTNLQTGQSTLVAVGGDRTGVPETVPTLQQADPAVASLVVAVGMGTATPDQINQLGTHLGAASLDSVLQAISPQPPAHPPGQPSGQTATVREQPNDINEATKLATDERTYQGNVNALQQQEYELGQKYLNTPGFGPAPWTPIMQWSPDGQAGPGGTGNPIGNAVAAGQASFPENLRQPTDYAAAYRQRGAEAAAADLQARQQEMTRRTNEYNARLGGAQRLEAIGQNRRAADKGRQQLATSEAFLSSRSQNDKNLQPFGDSAWVHGENAGLVGDVQNLDDAWNQMQWSWFPEQQVAQIQDDVRTGRRARDYRTMNVLPPGYQHGGQVQTRARVADVLPPGVPRFAGGGYASGYGQGSGGYAQAWPVPEGGDYGDPTHAPLVKRQQQREEIRFQQGLDERGFQAAMQRIQMQSKQRITEAERQHEQAIAELNQRTEQTLAELALEARGVGMEGYNIRATEALNQFVPRGGGTYAG